MYPKLEAAADQGACTLSPQVDSSEKSLHAFVTFIEYCAGQVYVGLGNRHVQVYGTGDDFQKSPIIGYHVEGLPICAARHSGDKGVLIGTDNSRLLRIANINGSHELITTACLEKGWIEQLACCSTGHSAYASGKTAYLLASDGRLLHQFPQVEGTVTGIKFSLDGKRLAVARYGGVAIYDTASGEQRQLLEWKGAHLNMSWSPDGQYLVTATPDKEIHCWEMATSKSFRMSGYPAKIRSLCWTADGKHLAAAGADSVTVWPFVNGDPSGKPPYEFGYSFQGIVTQVAAHPAEPIVAAGYSNGTVLIGRYLLGQAIIARAPLGHAVSALTWSEDGRYLFAGTESGDFNQIFLSATDF